MDFLGDLLPILIFLLIPVIRGINNSNKQKKEYQARQRTNPRPSYPSKDTTKSSRSWRDLVNEVGKEFKQSLEDEEKGRKAKAKRKTQRDYPAQPQSIQQPIKNITEQPKEKQIHYQEKKLYDEIKDSIGNKEGMVEETQEGASLKSSSLTFSSDPIVQGLIFSEILGAPKSKQR